MERDMSISAYPPNLCLLCRSTHGESECVDSQESCYTGTYSSRSSPTFSDIYLCSSATLVPSASSHRSSQYSTPTLYRTNSTQWKSRNRGLQSSKLLWMFSLTAVIALSSAASIAHRNTASMDYTGIIKSHRSTDIPDHLGNSDLQKSISTGNSDVQTFTSSMMRDIHRNIGAVDLAGISESEDVQDMDTASVDTYLESFGYYPHHHNRGDQSSDSRPEIREDVPVLGPALPQDLHIHHTQHEREQALRRLQKFFNLRHSGHLDQETRKIMTAKRCGVKDILEDDGDEDDDDEDDDEGTELEYDNNGVERRRELKTERERTITLPRQKKRRRKRYAFQTYKNGLIVKWRKDQLTWRLEIPSEQLNSSVQEETIRRAFEMWAKVIPIKFLEEKGEDQADIRLLFGKGEHGPKGDPVFDGRREDRNTLAHAWGPQVRSKGFPGDVHFDDDDDWSKPDELFIVAAHELGHSFGLLHSKDRASIMFPVYQDLPRLGQDDLDAVEYLYGPESDQSWRKKSSGKKEGEKQQHFTVRPEYRTRKPPQAMDTCDNVTVDAFLPDPSPQSRNFFIAVSGDRVHRVSPRGDILQSESLDSVYPDLPESPDVGLTVVQDQAIFFIKGETMWGYKQGSPIEGFPRPISEMGFPEQPQFSISLQDSNGNDRPLLFGKSYWWLFDSKTNTTVKYDPISTFSRDLPDDVHFVAQWTDQRLYAVSNNSYVVLDSIQRSATHEFPIAGKPDFLTPLCDEIRKPVPKEDYTQTIVVSSVVGFLALLAIGLGVFKFVQFYKKNYSDYI